MQETSTVIMWPEKLKVGSKSKRGESRDFRVFRYCLVQCVSGVGKLGR